MSRKPTPDVMSRLMDEPLSKRNDGKTINTAVNIAIKKESNKHSSEDEKIKEKATFNLSIDVLRKLEDKWMALRKMTRSKQISKTMIVETALEIVIAEFVEKEQESQLYRNISGNIAIKQ